MSHLVGIYPYEHTIRHLIKLLQYICKVVSGWVMPCADHAHICIEYRTNKPTVRSKHCGRISKLSTRTCSSVHTTIPREFVDRI